MKKPTDYSILLIGIIILIAVIASSCGHKRTYYYNAYSPGYGEYFVIKSYTPLSIDTLVNFDDEAIVTEERNGFRARILSMYTGPIGHH